MDKYRQNGDLSDFKALQQAEKGNWITDLLWALAAAALIMLAPAFMW